MKEITLQDLGEHAARHASASEAFQEALRIKKSGGEVGVLHGLPAEFQVFNISEASGLRLMQSVKSHK